MLIASATCGSPRTPLLACSLRTKRGKVMQGHIKSKIIERTITQYFRDNAHATFDGRVRTDEVISAVRHVLGDLFQARMSAYNVGEVYDAIRFMGPCGEGDELWLQMWGKPCHSDLVA
jgi:hypothetical protein